MVVTVPLVKDKRNYFTSCWDSCQETELTSLLHQIFFFLSAKWYHIPSRWNLQSLSGKHRSVKSFQQRVTRKFIKWRLLPGDWIRFQQEDNITAQFSLHPLLFASLFPGCLISTPPLIKFCTPNPILLIAS